VRRAQQCYRAALVGALVLASVFATVPAAAQQQIQLGELRQSVQRLRDQERQLAQEREQRFRAALQRQERLAQEAVTRRNNAEARSNALDREWNNNERRIAETQQLLTEREGNLGELFGVTRQVAGDAATVLQGSILSTQYGTPAEGEERAEFMRRMAGAKELPSIVELERLWYELMREMTDGGKVVKFRTSVANLDDEATPDDESKTRVEMDVVRVGPFTASSNGTYLGYLPSQKTLTYLHGRLVGELQAIGRNLQAAPANAGYQRAVVDPASGSLLSVYVDRPDLLRRIQEGQEVGYVIIAVGGIGALLALFQAFYLGATRMAVSAQLKNLANPSKSNPLGRVLLAFRGDGKRIQNSELAELRISEAVLREVPRLERFQAFLRLAVAAGPLLGLGIAIPLLFVNAGLAVMSRSVTQILDEQSQSMLADNAGRKS